MSVVLGAVRIGAAKPAPAKEPTKADIIAELAELGIQVGKGLTKAELAGMLAEAKKG